MKTSMSPEIKRNKHIIDAKNVVLGKLAVDVANKLRGKDKPHFVEHLDIGDYVTVVNAQKIYVTGKKLEQKTYFHHSGYIGSDRVTYLKDLLKNNPNEVIRHAVEGMLPKNRLRKNWIKRLDFKEEKDTLNTADQTNKESK